MNLEPLEKKRKRYLCVMQPYQGCRHKPATSHDKGSLLFQAKAVEIHHHPERVKLEVEHRKSGNPKNYDSFAGPFDITLIKLDTKLEFTNTVREAVELKQN